MPSSPALHVTLTDILLQQSSLECRQRCSSNRLQKAQSTVMAGDLAAEFTNLMFPSAHLDLHVPNGGVEVISFLL